MLCRLASITLLRHPATSLKPQALLTTLGFTAMGEMQQPLQHATKHICSFFVAGTLAVQGNSSSSVSLSASLSTSTSVRRKQRGSTSAATAGTTVTDDAKATANVTASTAGSTSALAGVVVRDGTGNTARLILPQDKPADDKTAAAEGRAEISANADSASTPSPPTPGEAAPAAAAKSLAGETVPQANRAAGASTGVPELIGRETDLFERVLGGLNPPEALDLIQVARDRAEKKLLPLESLANAITNALELSRQFPDLDPRELLKPAIARMQLDLARANAIRIKRLLPDTRLCVELLGKDPQDVSEKITRIVATFRSELSMQPPSQLLSHAWTFVKALRLPDDRLRQHLQQLLHAVGRKDKAQEFAQEFTGVLVSPTAGQLLGTADRVAVTLRLAQADAVGLLLRHPFLARSKQQLQHLEALATGGPAALKLPADVLLPALAKMPSLFRYDSCNSLAQKHMALATTFPDAGPQDLLALCSLRSVRCAQTPGDVILSLRTSAAIFGYTDPSQLLPMLLQPLQHQQDGMKQQQPRGSSSTGRYPYTFLLQPAATLAARAGKAQQLQGLSRDQAAKIVGWYPRTVLARDGRTQELKLAILQARLLGREVIQSEVLAPEITKMLRKCPMIANLAVDTCLQRIAALESALQLQPGHGSRLVLQAPQLLLLQPAALEQAVQQLVNVLGEFDKAQKLAAREPQVLLQMRSKQFLNGSLRQVSAIFSMLHPQAGHRSSADGSSDGSSSTTAANNGSTTTPAAWSAHASSSAAKQAPIGSSRRRSRYLGKQQQLWLVVEEAVSSAAKRAQQQQASVVPGRKGVKHKNKHGTEMRSKLVYGNGQQFSSHHPSLLEAACAYDLVRMAVNGAGAAVNLPSEVYQQADVAAMAAYIEHVRREQQQHNTAEHQLQSIQQPPKTQQQKQSTQLASQQTVDEQLQQSMQQLIAQSMHVKVGRQLLALRPETSQARLQTLADLTGISVQSLLAKGLRHDWYLHRVLGLSPQRMEQGAVQLQQHLGLQHKQLQQLVRTAPSLLLVRHETLAAKVDLLHETFTECWLVCCSNTAISTTSSSCAGSSKMKQLQQLLPSVAGMECLRRAVLFAPQLLLLKADRVIGRVQLLQQACNRQQQLLVQLMDRLATGSVGRWLTAGDAHYEELHKLVGGKDGAEKLAHLNMDQLFRRAAT